MNTCVIKHVSNWLWLDVFMQSSEYSNRKYLHLYKKYRFLSDSPIHPNHNEVDTCSVTRVFISTKCDDTVNVLSTSHSL